MLDHTMSSVVGNSRDEANGKHAGRKGLRIRQIKGGKVSPEVMHADVDRWKAGEMLHAKGHTSKAPIIKPPTMVARAGMAEE